MLDVYRLPCFLAEVPYIISLGGADTGRRGISQKLCIVSSFFSSYGDKLLLISKISYNFVAIMKKTTTILLLVLLSLGVNAAREVTSAQLKLVGDGKTLNTPAIQAAIDKLSRKGGGKLTLLQGKYLTGAIQLKSGVELHLEAGAELLGSTDPKDYYQLRVGGEGDVVRKDNSKYGLILAQGIKNIRLTGYGTINGQGRELALTIDSLCKAGTLKDENYSTRLRRPSEIMRPKLFFFSECDGVEITHLTLRESACWGLSFDQCRNMKLDNLTVLNRAYWNNDGIDLTDCADVEVANCYINAADDGICLKSYHLRGVSENIHIHDCHIESSASAVKFGTASWGAFRDIKITNIDVLNTFRSCIAIESVDGARIENILVDGMKARNTGNAIFVKLGNRAGDGTGYIRDVTLKNFDVELAAGRPDGDYDIRGPEVSYFHNPFPSSITGYPGHPVQGVVLDSIRIVAPGNASKGMAYVRVDEVPENEKGYPEFTMFGELPAWGFFFRHVDGLTMRHVKLIYRQKDFRSPIVKDDVKNCEEEDVAVKWHCADIFVDHPEYLPSFPGGSSALLKYIADHVRHPDGKGMGQDRVVVSFVVERNGDLTGFEIVRPSSPALDAEALRVVKAMPRWEPGRRYMNGYGLVPVRTRYNLPITFKTK